VKALAKLLDTETKEDIEAAIDAVRLRY